MTTSFGPVKSVDRLMQVTAEEELTGYQFLNVVAKDKARNGDAFGSDSKREGKSSIS